MRPRRSVPSRAWRFLSLFLMLVGCDEGDVSSSVAPGVDGSVSPVADAGSNLDAAVVDDAADASDAGPTDRARLAALENARAAAWRTRIHQVSHTVSTDAGATGWEFFFDGVDTPADPGALNLPNQLAWDVPVDDDYVQDAKDAGGILPNTPSRGFYTINRVSTPDRRGNIQRRLENVTFASGVTIETRLRVDASSEPNAAWVQHVFAEGNFNLFVSPTSVGLGPVGGAPSVVLALDATAFHTYRLVRMPNARTVMLFVDADSTRNTPDLTLEAPTQPASNPDEPPYVLMGDNSGPGGIEAFVVFDYVALAPGGFLPGAPIRVPSGAPPPLPKNETATERFVSTGGYDGTELPHLASVDAGGPILGGSLSGLTLGTSLSPPQPGVLQVDTDKASFRMDDLSTLTRRGDWTLEFVLRILPQSAADGVGVSFIDGNGATAIVWSPNRVSLMMGVKAAGLRHFPMNTTDRMHRYRLVHREAEYFVHLYVDDDPVPVNADYRYEGTLFRPSVATQTRLQFGTQKPAPTRRGIAQIDAIRWQAKALAPAIRE